jgi:RNA recognition motif-containing protein
VKSICATSSSKIKYAGYEFFQIAIDRETGRSRGFGFVSFEDSESMDKAIDGMNGELLGGRNITVSKANERSRRWRR